MDLYAVLGLTHAAAPNAIRAAYRQLAKLYHPDVSVLPDAHARFIRITEAYEILIDPEKRQRYDRSRLSPSPHTASARQQTRYERDVRSYQQQAQERAERFSRMKYTRFDHEYFDTALGYAAPKMLGCLGIGVLVITVILLLFWLITSLSLPDEVSVVLALVFIFGAIPTIAWLSTQFDDWHNRGRKRRRADR